MASPPGRTKLTFVNMKDREIDRTGWDAGPWDDEPDRVDFTTNVGLPGLILRNRLGSLCGYVAVDAAHPLYETDYHKPDLDVHGGLTYSDKCQEDGPVCHTPAPGEPDDVWWFGFDCGHGMDISPAMDARERQMGFEPLRADWISYKTVDYVRTEVESLARQLAELT